MAEFISISGQLNVKPQYRVQAELITDQFCKLGITEGYLQTSISLTLSGLYELEIIGECAISDSLGFRDLIKELDKIITVSSNINIQDNKLEDPWSTVVTFETIPQVVKKQSVYGPRISTIYNN